MPSAWRSLSDDWRLVLGLRIILAVSEAMGL